jgi:hypothetical protein
MLDAQVAALKTAGAERVFSEKQSGAKTDRAALAKALAAGCGVEDMAAEAPGLRRESSPEAAKRCASSRRALRATTVPDRINTDGEIRIRLFSRQEVWREDCA